MSRAALEASAAVSPTGSRAERGGRRSASGSPAWGGQKKKPRHSGLPLRKVRQEVEQLAAHDEAGGLLARGFDALGRMESTRADVRRGADGGSAEHVLVGVADDGGTLRTDAGLGDDRRDGLRLVTDV